MDIIGERTLFDLLKEAAQQHGDHEFLVHEPLHGEITSLSFKQMAKAASRIGAGFQHAGLSKGDRVFVFLRNTADYVPLWLGIMCSGGIAVPANIYLTAPEVAYLLSDSQPSFIVTEPGFLPLLQEAIRELQAPLTIILADEDAEQYPDYLTLDQLLQDETRLQTRDLVSSDVAEIIYTSGTSSRPKGVMHTHANLLWCGLMVESLDDKDRFFNNKPLFHANCQSTVLGCLTYGATAIIGERYSASRYLAQLRHHRATICSLSGMLCRTLLNQPPTSEDRQHSVRLGRYAINITSAEIQRFTERFGIPLKNGYGMSEAMLSITSEVRGTPSTYPSIGRAAVGREVFIIDEAGQEVEIGQVGEIVVRGQPGRNLMLGYYNNEAATREAFAGGWLHTGDLGSMDAQGNFYFFGRKKEVIKRSGENISAAEVEEVLADHPDVLDVAVIGVPDPVRDQAVKAFVVPRKAGVEAETLREHCRSRLAYFKVPEYIVLIDELPRNASGKVLKRELEAM